VVLSSRRKIIVFETLVKPSNGWYLHSKATEEQLKAKLLAAELKETPDSEEKRTWSEVLRRMVVVFKTLRQDLK